ncbi:hypothetical protein I5H01_gp052 [Mycobacterium phage MarkPhew]|uniref:DUF3310 domain-containing protein n=1 Tax=Mycobacterium phage MarkPhew TaxID=2725625 RepID=A0A6M3SWK0_9CAUD|nr:hypothetical protein I5H01_gp052 [Mycobacterium phage MarkPhew]QJD50355.1 hypothetical protein SEA_MARKPHEW_55 [Mycobacterium phage MarkPhew]
MSDDRGSLLCEVCGKYDAQVFDPCGAAWCKVCDLMGLGELAVRERVAEVAEGVGRAFDRAVLFGLDEPLSLPFCDDLAKADRTWIYQDANGAHWGWSRQAEQWVAWNTAPYRIGVGAVGPFAQMLRNSIELAHSNSDGKPGPALTSEDTTAGEVDEQTPDMVNQPSHYNNGPPCKGCGRPIECLDITEGMGFCLGNTVKYVWRCDLKHDAIEDLRKAAVYLAREITRREQQLAADATN